MIFASHLSWLLLSMISGGLAGLLVGMCALASMNSKGVAENLTRAKAISLWIGILIYSEAAIMAFIFLFIVPETKILAEISIGNPMYTSWHKIWHYIVTLMLGVGLGVALSFFVFQATNPALIRERLAEGSDPVADHEDEIDGINGKFKSE
jgi:hypothetical protein